jgi:hypothetical protein
VDSGKTSLLKVLARRFLDQGIRPFFMIGEFRADALSEFFLGEGTQA